MRTMKRRRLKKGIRRLIKFGIVLLAILSIMDVAESAKMKREIEEKQVMENYIQCLQDNFTQRDYCSRQVSGTNYRILDQKLEKYGYTYKQVGYDLYLVQIDK